MTRQKHGTHRGFGVLEILIASAIVSVVIVSLSYVVVLSHRLSVRSSDKIRANFLAEQALEAYRFARDAAWIFISLPATGVNYSVPIDSVFTKTIRFEEVRRDENDDIVTSGGTPDNNTRKIIITISWVNGSTSAETYLSNIFNN
ncbi:hypothetical protein A3J56_00625 [Candidatus Giovannonibacteria bacterium RIFCSPHIGHO2_02_FULL_46_20]|uniref:Type II secretion system protein GspI C-terminal domain-containing protein n=1 Tax=Candidatus Giovannonibacteria bacterium RIFCSPHIGHO2_02_FULL_46_20 TaxID=1798338 RepID=A0A1F5WDH7_9BACT|nr:MAG: hypothetical protein A3J56_00625 [Candidatus Giovannonibacteria bacterium RIFCSPHIGHO2_02_FULL_46_20]